MKIVRDKNIYVIGHTHPDTDSICSAMVYAHFLRERHKKNVLPARAGEINHETKFVLKYWKEKAPLLLRNASGKNIIIVDHNEIHQAVKNIREANLLEIIDHHRIGDIETIHPIPFENEPRGATSAVISERYSWFRIPFTKKIAGLILSGLLSDTLLLKSPTTTAKDRSLARKMAKICGVNLQKYGREMLEAGCDVEGYSPKRLLLLDFKDFHLGMNKVGIGQVPVMGFAKILKKKKELLKEVARLYRKNYTSVLLMITDVIASNSYLLFVGNEDKIKKLFHQQIEHIEGIPGGIMYLPKVVSRKKQIQPKILELMK